MRRRLPVLLLLGVISSVPLWAAPQTAQRYRAHLGTVKQKIRDVRQKIAVVKQKQRVATATYYSTQQKLGGTRQNLHVTRVRLDSAHSQLTVISSELRKAERKLYDKRLALTQRLSDAYKTPPPSYMAALVTSDSAWAAMTRMKMIQRVVQSDVRLIDEVRQTREEVRQRREAQRSKISEINSLQGQLAMREQEEKQLAWQQHAELQSIIADRVSYERALDDLEAESYRIAARIRALQATPAGRRRLQTAFRGGFIRPVSGPITSPFGRRFHPILHKWKMHTGVDISCRTGTPVHAAAAGTVVSAGWEGAYGNAVVIDHGGGVVTLYGHCSSLAVRTGQQVRQGQVIARSGSTGWSTGPHLHFEVQRNGHPVSPF